MSLKLYLDILSQPSRSLYILLKLANIPFEECYVSIGKGEHLTDEFKQQVSRFQKLPVLHDGEFKLTESVAVVRYLTREKNIPDKWYPRDSKKQARVDEYLEWQHNNIRTHCSVYFLYKYVIPLMTGKEPESGKIAKLEKNMSKSLDSIEKLWLSQGDYIAGNHITIADIFAASEIEQPRMAGYEPRTGRPILKAWLDRVREETNPFYDEAHKVLNKIASNALKEAKSKL